MLSKELLRRVHQIELTTRKMVNDVMSGQYRSHFKGQGMQFSEHRLYYAGDDIRHIDWNASARTSEPLIKKYEEERELNVLLVVDASGSEGFGTASKLKSEVAAEIGGMLAAAAIHTGDKVGILFFAGEVEKIIPPKKGRGHVLRVIREIIGYQSTSKAGGTDLAGALDAARRIMKHGGVVFVISDFIATGYDLALRQLGRRNDVVAVRVSDAHELEMPPVGQFVFVDPETGAESVVDSSSYAFRKWLKDKREELETDTATALKGGRVERLDVMTKDDYAEAVVRFFKARARRGHR